MATHQLWLVGRCIDGPLAERLGTRHGGAGLCHSPPVGVLRERVRTMRVDWDERAVGRDFSDDASSSSMGREAWARDGLVESSHRGWRRVSGLVDAGSWHEYSPQAEKTGNFSQASSAIRSIQLIQRDGSAGSWQHHRVSLVPVDIGDQSAGRSVGPTARNEREWPRRTPS